MKPLRCSKAFNPLRLIQTTRMSSTTAAVPKENNSSATGPASFCVCAWVPCPVRAAVDDQLLRDDARRDPFPPFAITTTGAPHTQSFYTGVETTWGFPPTGRKIKINQATTSPEPLMDRGFIMVTRQPRRGCVISLSLYPLKKRRALFDV